MRTSASKTSLYGKSSKRRDRPRRRAAGSASSERFQDIRQRESQSDESDLPSELGKAGNQFAALSPTEPAPDTVADESPQRTKSEFTFRVKRLPNAATYPEGPHQIRESPKPLSTEAERKIDAQHSLSISPLISTAPPNIAPTLNAKPRNLHPIHKSNSFPTNPPSDPPSLQKPPSLIAEDSVPKPPPTLSTANASSDTPRQPTHNTTRQTELHTPASQSPLPPPTPHTTNPLSAKRRKLSLLRPKVQLPSTHAMMIDDESPEHSLCGISESEMPMDEGSKCKIWAVEVEIRAPGSEGRSKATQTERDTDERAGAGRLPMSRAASSDFDNGDFVDEGYASCEERGRTGGLSRDDADGDWEWVG